MPAWGNAVVEHLLPTVGTPLNYKPDKSFIISTIDRCLSDLQREWRFSIWRDFYNIRKNPLSIRNWQPLVKRGPRVQCFLVGNNRSTKSTATTRYYQTRHQRCQLKEENSGNRGDGWSINKTDPDSLRTPPGEPASVQNLSLSVYVKLPSFSLLRSLGQKKINRFCKKTAESSTRYKYHKLRSKSSFYLEMVPIQRKFRKKDPRHGKSLAVTLFVVAITGNIRWLEYHSLSHPDHLILWTHPSGNSFGAVPKGRVVAIPTFQNLFRRKIAQPPY